MSFGGVCQEGREEGVYQGGMSIREGRDFCQEPEEDVYKGRERMSMDLWNKKKMFTRKEF